MKTVIEMLTERFIKAKPILEKLEKHRFEAYFVGGCVRDLLLNRSIKDIDIATSATPEEVQKLFPKVIPVGIEHGTVIVRHEHESYEVTTFRLDGDYSDSRHPDSVEFIKKIDKDLERRDFTINALAMDKTGEIIDLFEGEEDIEARLIRTVGDGSKRFKEDALRIIRALRFSSQLGFKIHPATLQHMVTNKSDIFQISVERITNEMEKFFAGEYVQLGLEYLYKAEIYLDLPVFKDEPILVQKLPREMKPLASFAEVIVLFHYLYPKVSISTWIKAWKCSNRMKRTAFELFEDLSYYKQNGIDNEFIYQLTTDRFEPFIRLTDLLFNKKIIYNELHNKKLALPIQVRNELAIDGNDLLSLYPERKGGPWIKNIIETVEKKVVTGELKNNYQEIKEWLRWNQQEIN